MKDDLIRNLEEFFDHSLDYRSRFLNALIEGEKSGELDTSAADDLRSLRASMCYLEDRIIEFKESIGKRVYCVQVTSNVEMTIKVLAKNEDDALEWACQVADTRIRKTLGREHDCDYYSTGDVLGDESIEDDVADEEYEYDE